MQVWGWRIPFCMAFVTALIGYQLRAGLPEPKAFLNAARAEKKAKEAEDAANGEGSPVDPTMTAVPSTKRCAGSCRGWGLWARAAGPARPPCVPHAARHPCACPQLTAHAPSAVPALLALQHGQGRQRGGRGCHDLHGL